MIRKVGQKIHWIIILFSIPVIGYSQPLTTTFISNAPEPIANNAVCGGFKRDSFIVFSFGGIDTLLSQEGIHQKCFGFNTVSKKWVDMPNLPDSLGKIAAAATNVGDTIFIFGGYHVFPDGTEKSSSRVHRYSISQNTFLPDGAPIPVPIDDHVQVNLEDTAIMLITGWSDNGNVNAVQVYNPKTDSWTMGTQLPNSSSYGSFGASGTILQSSPNELYYFGGAVSAGVFGAQPYVRKGTVLGASFFVDWTITGFFNPPKYAYRAGCISIGDNIIWIGGSDQTYNYDGKAYTDESQVQPNHRIRYYNPANGFFEDKIDSLIPMDIRGVAKENSRTFYLLGGIQDNGIVTDQLVKIEAGLMNVKPISSRENLTISYNSTLRELLINSKSEKIGKIEILDLSGRVIISDIASDRAKRNFLNEYSKGVYFLQNKGVSYPLVIY